MYRHIYRMEQNVEYVQDANRSNIFKKLHPEKKLKKKKHIKYFLKSHLIGPKWKTS